MFHYKLKGYKPLLFKDGILYASNGLRLFKSVDKGRNFVFIAKAESSVLKRYASSFGLIARILRLGFHYLVKIPKQETYIAVIRKSIIVKTTIDDDFVKVFSIPRGSRPLNLCLGRDNEILFGEYFSNKERDTVHIYRSKPPYQTWEIVYIFPADSIRHVHHISYDKTEDKYWILTGDYGQEAGFWFCENTNFTTLTPVIRGGQLSRAVTLLNFGGKILTATDTQIAQNYIFEIDTISKKRNLLQEIQGPCFDIIYTGGIYLVTTVIEKSEVNHTNYVHLWGSLDGKKWFEIYHWKKDFFPKWLHVIFQFSRVEIIRNEDNTKDIFLYARGVKNDNYTLIQLDAESVQKKLQTFQN